MIKSSLWLFVADNLHTIVTFALFPLYTNVLSTSQFGQIAVITFFGVLVSSFITLQLSSSIPKNYTDLKKSEFITYFSSIFSFSLCLFLLLLLFFFILFYFNVFEVIYSNIIHLNTLLMITVISTYLTQVTNLFNKLLISLGNTKLIFYRKLALAPISLFCGYYFVIYSEWGVVGYFLSILIPSVFSFLISYFSVYGFIKYFFSFFYIKKALKVSIPLVPSSLLIILSTRIDVIILEKYVTQSSLGVYFCAFRIAQLYRYSLDAFNACFVPHLFAKLKSEKLATFSLLKAHLYKLSLICIIIHIVLYFVSPSLVNFFLHPEYKDISLYLPFLFLGYNFRTLYSTFASIALYEDSSYYIFINSLIIFFISTILYFVLIKEFSLYGASSAFILISFLSSFFMHNLNFFTIDGYSAFGYKIFVLPIIYTLIFLLLFHFNTIFYENYS